MSKTLYQEYTVILRPERIQFPSGFLKTLRRLARITGKTRFMALSIARIAATRVAIVIVVRLRQELLGLLKLLQTQRRVSNDWAWRSRSI